MYKFVSHNFPDGIVEAVKKGLYLPAFESRGVQINDECASITRAVYQLLFLKDDSSKPNESFLNNLQVSAELYERIAQGKQISVREERKVFALSMLLDDFKRAFDSPTSSLRSTQLNKSG